MASLQYGGGQGYAGLRDRLLTLMLAEGVTADADDVVVTTGAQQALDLVGKIFVNPGDLIAVEAPAYVGALTAFSAYEPRYLQIDLDDDGMIVDQLEEALLRGERPKFVYTCPNFGNPAGVTLSYARREQLVSLCREASIPIIEDNPYGMLRFEGDPLPCLRTLDPENVIYLGTVSKVFSPGVRVGWALAEQSVVQRLVLAKEAADLCGSSFTMMLTERYFAGDRWQDQPGHPGRHLPIAPRHDARGHRRTLPRRGSCGPFRQVASTCGSPCPSGSTRKRCSRRQWNVESPTCRAPPSTPMVEGRTRCDWRSAIPTEDRIREGIQRLGLAAGGRRTALSEPAPMKIAVLAGGRTPERDVSLRSGHRVKVALEELGHDASVVDPGECALVETLTETGPDLCYLALHGKEGEDGTVQRLLDLLADAVHGHRRVRLRGRVRQGPGEGRARSRGRCAPLSGSRSKGGPCEISELGRRSGRQPSGSACRASSNPRGAARHWGSGSSSARPISPRP